MEQPVGRRPGIPGRNSVAFWQFFLAIVLGAALGGIFALFFWNGVCGDREK